MGNWKKGSKKGKQVIIRRKNWETGKLGNTKFRNGKIEKLRKNGNGKEGEIGNQWCKVAQCDM